MARDLARSVQTSSAEVLVDGDVAVPAGASGVLLFVHGSGSSRHSPRSRMVVAPLQAAGYATLLAGLAGIAVVAEATNLFPEPGTLDRVVELALGGTASAHVRRRSPWRNLSR